MAAAPGLIHEVAPQSLLRCGGLALSAPVPDLGLGVAPLGAPALSQPGILGRPLTSDVV